MNSLTPCRCSCHASQMPLDELEQLARDIGAYPPERDDTRRRFIVRLGGEEFFARFEETSPSG